ncbi:MAG TPA: hypothetical protein VMJ93_00445 [Verrucomicrobiae bacterium]|nr:hypothetical protein [Verrucomicrobiae bacterium]
MASYPETGGGKATVEEPAERYDLVRRLFARGGVDESVTTLAHFRASPESLWRRILFYEDVPGRPPFLLRAFLPHPLRSEGDKTRVGGEVQCTYDRGDLMKRITAVAPGQSVEFDVVNQRLGIEGCVRASGGSCQIRGSGGGSDVALTTNYVAYLRPRFLWRPLERLLAGQLHRYILDGMRKASPHPIAARRPASTERALPESAPPGALACKASTSRFPR